MSIGWRSKLLKQFCAKVGLAYFFEYILTQIYNRCMLSYVVVFVICSLMYFAAHNQWNFSKGDVHLKQETPSPVRVVHIWGSVLSTLFLSGWFIFVFQFFSRPSSRSAKDRKGVGTSQSMKIPTVKGVSPDQTLAWGGRTNYGVEKNICWKNVCPDFTYFFSYTFLFISTI